MSINPVSAGMLADLLKPINFFGDRSIVFKGISVDSRKVEQEYLFAAIDGFKRNGAEFIPDAIKAGAKGIMVNSGFRQDIGLPEGFPVFVVENLRQSVSKASDIIYDHPSGKLSMLAVTGTNGKSTVLSIVKSILAEDGKKPFFLGTTGYGYGNFEEKADLTTPEAPVIHRLMAAAVLNGAKAGIMEVSSHSLALQRVSDVMFEGAAFTNLTRDHLDFHKSMENYKKIKFSLFQQVKGRIVTCVDDPVGRELAGLYMDRVLKCGYASDADIRPLSVSGLQSGMKMVLAVAGKTISAEVPLHGKHNVRNVLVAAGLSLVAGVALETVVKGLERMHPVPGRMEKAAEGAGVTFWVDYAHTPDAILSVLDSFREMAAISGGRLIVVFGCGGDRDRGKRPEMGEAVSRFADLAVVTSDNPRSENPDSIIDEILPGIPGGLPRIVEKDRKRAIFLAAESAMPGDFVVILGKGHETYQILADEVIHFDDRVVASEAASLLIEQYGDLGKTGEVEK